jgi:hypothetical protein
VNIVSLQVDTFLFLIGLDNDDEAPVVGPEVNRPVDAAATTEEIADAFRDPRDTGSERRQEFPPLNRLSRDSATETPRG